MSLLFKIEKSKGKGLNVEGTGTARAPEKQRNMFQKAVESQGVKTYRSPNFSLPVFLSWCLCIDFVCIFKKEYI